MCSSYQSFQPSRNSLRLRRIQIFDAVALARQASRPEGRNEAKRTNPTSSTFSGYGIPFMISDPKPSRKDAQALPRAATACLRASG